MKKVLVYGYGNPGRQDDGLGVLCAESVGRWAGEEGLTTISTDSNYQLNIEDADRIAPFDLVIFADASVADVADFRLEKIQPDLKTDFTMHAVSPAFVYGLCRKLFSVSPECYQLHIKGYNFEFMRELSCQAEKNLNGALDFLKEHIRMQLAG